MKGLNRIVSHPLPLKVKLVLAAGLLIFGLFIVYNSVQFLVLRQWMLNLEETSIHQMMAELQDHFSNRLPTEDKKIWYRHRRFIESINQNSPLIRILDGNGNLLLAVSDGTLDTWLPHKTVTRTQLIHTTHNGDRLLVLRSPLSSGRQFIGTIEIVYSLATFSRLSDMLLNVMLAGGMISVVISGLGGWIVAKRLLRPVRKLSDAMRKAEENGLQERVALAGIGDELSQMAGLYNKLMDQVEASFQQQKQFVEDASHELKTPISILEGHLSLLDRWGKKDPLVLDESLQIALRQATRLNGIVKELLDLTRAEAGVLRTIDEPINIKNVIRQTTDSFAVLHPDFVFETDFTGWDSVIVRIDQRHLEQILLILLDNAVKYSLDQKRISLQVFYHDGQAILRIRDRGMGIPEAHLPYLFNRFYRVDKTRTRERGGTGLGLSIAKRLVENYKGAIAVASKVGEGTTVTVTLPIYNAKKKSKCFPCPLRF